MSTFVDKNTRSIDGVNTYVDEVLETIESAADEQDTLKVSHSSFVVIGNKTIRNFGEDCVDLCRVQNSQFRNLVLQPRGKNGVTIKGASREISIGASFDSHGSECDIELGQFDNYWYPGRPPTQGISLRLDAGFEQPIVVRVWDAATPAISWSKGTQVKIEHIPKIVWFPYFLVRYIELRAANLVRRLKGLPQIKTS